MRPPLCYLARFEEISQRLLEGSSIILEAPRHYGKLALGRTIAEKLRTEHRFQTAILSSQPGLSFAELDPDMLAEPFLQQVGAAPDIAVNLGLDQVVLQAVERCAQPTLVIVHGGERRNVLNHFRLLAAFDRILERCSAQGESRLSVLALDDGSLFQRNDNIIVPTDTLSFFKPFIRLRPFNEAEIREVITGGSSLENDPRADDTGALVRWIAENTGGHHGLVAEVLAALLRGGAGLGWPTLCRRLEDVLAASPLLDYLGEALRDDPVSLSETALEYRTPELLEAHNPRINVLCQLGILHRATASQRFALCPGAITRMIESFAERFRRVPNRIGTIIIESGHRLFVKEEIHPSDDDFVVLHLSDLHVGPDYPHAIRSKRYSLNIERNTLGDMLAADLKRMELTGRVDAVVLGGDFVDDAHQSGQFNRAREVVEELMGKIQVKRQRILVIPGNHDVDWKPDENAVLEAGRPVSMENFHNFCELLKLPKAAWLSLPSRSGKARLRIVGLDSNHVEGPESGGMGFVSHDSLTTARDALAKDSAKHVARRNEGATSALHRMHTWLAVHHHLMPTTSSTVESAMARSVSVMANASVVLAHAAQWGVELALHGHEHEPAVTVSRRWPAGPGLDFSPLVIAGCGSVGASVRKLGPLRKNQYFVAYRRASDIILRSRCMDANEIGFAPHHDILIPQDILPKERPSTY